MPEKTYPTKEIIDSTIHAYADAVRQNPNTEVENGTFVSQTLKENAEFQALLKAGEINTIMGGPKGVAGNLRAVAEVGFEMGIYAGLAAAGARAADEPLRNETPKFESDDAGFDVSAVEAEVA